MANSSLEGALLRAMNTYLELHENLRAEIIKLAEQNKDLTETALLHDPSGLINYLETLCKTAKAQVTRDTNILLDAIGAVQEEMERRMKLNLRAIGPYKIDGFFELQGIVDLLFTPEGNGDNPQLP
ncbi:hypothetical protein Hte_009364 [Hypoxylon texense]